MLLNICWEQELDYPYRLHPRGRDSVAQSGLPFQYIEDSRSNGATSPAGPPDDAELALVAKLPDSMSPHFHPRGEREGADTEAVPAMVQLNLAQGGAVADFDLLEAAEGFASVSHAAHEVARPALGRTWSVCRPRNHSQRQPTPLTSRLGGTPATRALRPAPRGGPCVAPPVRLGRPPWFARCSTRASSLTEVGRRCQLLADEGGNGAGPRRPVPRLRRPSWVTGTGSAAVGDSNRRSAATNFSAS